MGSGADDILHIFVWQGPGGGRLVWRLYWDGKHWRLNYNWLKNDFNSNYRLVASRNFLCFPHLLMGFILNFLSTRPAFFQLHLTFQKVLYIFYYQVILFPMQSVKRTLASPILLKPFLEKLVFQFCPSSFRRLLIRLFLKIDCLFLSRVCSENLSGNAAKIHAIIYKLKLIFE